MLGNLLQDVLGAGDGLADKPVLGLVLEAVHLCVTEGNHYSYSIKSLSFRLICLNLFTAINCLAWQLGNYWLNYHDVRVITNINPDYFPALSAATLPVAMVEWLSVSWPEFSVTKLACPPQNSGCPKVPVLI